MLDVEKLANEIINGKNITKDEAMELYSAPLEVLTKYANKIREYFCKNDFDICTIINAKSGRCSEDCKFCAQSAFNNTEVDEYPLLSKEQVVREAKNNANLGVLRFSIVTSGRTLSDLEIDKLVEIVREIVSTTDIKVCVSAGLLSTEQFIKLKEAGVSRIHNNLETSPDNFCNICSTHSINDKIEAIKRAQAVGLQVCSGGIVGLGESISDRINMAFTLKELGIKSIPINMLNAIKGTPFQDNIKITDAEMQRIVAVYRFILPTTTIRLAGGRGIMKDKGIGCFKAGANATISGDMLTTAGITVATDMQIIKELGFIPKINE